MLWLLRLIGDSWTVRSTCSSCPKKSAWKPSWRAWKHSRRSGRITPRRTLTPLWRTPEGLTMARKNIDRSTTRDKLEPRREPYWGAPIERGLFIGFRKLDAGGTWIARWRDEDGRQRYQSLGHAD